MQNSDDSLLILLIGSNPLPNYLAACALRASTVALVYTTETEETMKRLKGILDSVLVDVDVQEYLVEDATSACEIKRTMNQIFRDKAANVRVLLHYTGGTKVMSAHALMAFYENGGQSKDDKDEDASYLDEGNSSREPRIRFDNENSTLLSEYHDVPLKLETILALHGITHKTRQPKNPAPTIQDAKNILYKVLEDVDVATKLYEEKERLEALKKINDMIAQPFSPEDLGLQLSLAQIPDTSMNASVCEQWRQFIGGGWLEEWLGDTIENLKLSPEPEVTVGVNAFRGKEKANLEMDLVVVRGHRSYFISCTTDKTKGLCKSKVFELVVRSRQLGGDLARSALVCLANDDTVGKLRKDIEELWGSSNATKVFGFSDIQTWSDCGGKQANIETLKRWLES